MLVRVMLARSGAGALTGGASGFLAPPVRMCWTCHFARIAYVLAILHSVKALPLDLGDRLGRRHTPKRDLHQAWQVIVH